MKKKEVIRKYNFSDSKLVTIGKEKLAFMRRDASQFSTYGIGVTQFDALEAAINVFSDTTTDIEAVNTLKNTTTTKDAKGEELRVAIRDVMSRVVLQFNEGSANYKKFGTELLSQQLDSDLLVTSKRVVRVATEFFSDIETRGVTTQMLTNITSLRNEFEDLIIEVKLKIGERDTQQQDRVEKANAIYEKVAAYSQTGLAIWTTSDVAKYNDYVIYNTVSGEEEPTEPKN